MAISIRRFDYERDVRDLIAWMPDLYEQNFPGFKATPEFLARRRMALRSAARDPWEEVLVAVDGQEALGFVWVFVNQDWDGRHRGEIAALYVVPERRGRGLGRLLLEEGEAVLRQWGCRRIQLAVTASNEPAVALYRAHGYAVTRYHMERSF